MQTVTVILVNRCQRCEIPRRAEQRLEINAPLAVSHALERALTAARAEGWTIAPDAQLCPVCSRGGALCGAITDEDPCD